MKRTERTNNLFKGEGINKISQPLERVLDLSSYITTFGGIPQVLARSVPSPVLSQTRLGGLCAVPVRSPQSYPRSDGATRAACAHSVARRSRLYQRPTGRTSRGRASSRVVSPWGARHQGILFVYIIESQTHSPISNSPQVAFTLRQRGQNRPTHSRIRKKRERQVKATLQLHNGKRQAYPFLDKVHLFGIIGESCSSRKRYSVTVGKEGIWIT
jgi:hypothetical protein